MLNPRLIEALMEGIAPIIREHNARSIEIAVAPLLARIAELEARPVAKDGKDGINGKDANPALIEQMVTEAFAKIPVPKDGRDGVDGKAGEPGKDGIDGKDADPELIEQMVTHAIGKIPVPKDGRDGVDGKAGEPGKDGINGKDADPELIERMVTEAIGNIPVPKDGRDGVDGKDADPAVIERAVVDAFAKVTLPKDGRDGVDGKDADPAVIERAVAEAVAKIPPPRDGLPGVPGLPGRDGKDGRDGINFDEIEPFDDKRVFGLKFKAGEKTVAVEWAKSSIADWLMGPWRQGATFKYGELVIRKGSLYAAMRDTLPTDAPNQSDAFVMITQAGKDGRDGVMKQAPAPSVITLK